jgi:uncharacterized protein
MRNDDVGALDTGRYEKSIFALRDFKKGEIVYEISGPVVKTPTIYTIPIGVGEYIDDESIGRFLCHSCEPNCGIKNKRQVIAMMDIKKGEEITVDYAMFVSEYGSEISENELKCRCGKATCRGRLGSYRRLPEVLKKKYAGYISEYLLKWGQF